MLTVLHRDEEGNEFLYEAEKVVVRRKEDKGLYHGLPGIHVLNGAADHAVYIPLPERSRTRMEGDPGPVVFVMNSSGKTIARHFLCLL